MKTYLTKAERQGQARKFLAGTSKYITKNIVLAGESVSEKDIANAIQASIDAEDACDELRGKLRVQLRASRAATRNAKQLTSSVKRYIITHYGENSPVLEEFGFSPRKVAQRTVAEKAQAVEKQLATRAARHTMGSRQKAEVHGDVSTPATPSVNGTNGAAQAAVLSLNGSSH